MLSGMVEIAPYSIITYMITSTLAIPVWVRLAKRFGKVKLWFWAMIGTAFSFSGMFALAFIESTTAQVIWLIFLSVMCGIFAGCGNTIGPSVASDVIDYDELMTGERKEGVYLASKHPGQLEPRPAPGLWPKQKLHRLSQDV